MAQLLASPLPTLRTRQPLHSALAALLIPLALLGFCPAPAVAQKPQAVPAAADFSGAYSEKDVIPLDAVMAVIEDRPILGSQWQAKLRTMQAMAGPGQSPVQADQVYRELFEGRLIAWDANRQLLEIQDSDLERMVDAMAAKLGLKGGRAELLAMAQDRGIDAGAYQAYLRQALLEARWEAAYRPPPGAPATQPALTRAQRLAALEAEALIDRPEGLLGLRPLPQRTCLPRTLPKGRASSPGKEPMIAAVCIEGGSDPGTAARLAELTRTVPPQAPLSRDAVARSLTELLAGSAGAEAAAAYGLPLRPGGGPSGPLLVVYRLRLRPLLSGIELTGAPAGVAIPTITVAPNTRYSHRELRAQLDPTIVALHNAGYLSAMAHAERLPRRSDNEPLRVHIKLSPGPRTYIARIALPGVAESRLSEVLTLLGLRPGDPVSEFGLLVGRGKLSEYYVDRGFVKGYIESHTTEPAPPRADGSPQVAVRMVVTEGKQYRLGTIKLVGALPLPEAELQKVLKTQRGDLFRGEALRKDLERLIEAGKRAGKHVTLDPATSVNDTTAIVDLTLTFISQPPPSP